MINPLIAALGLDLDLSAEEIADVIWLATQMQQSVPLRTRTDTPAQEVPQTPTLSREKSFAPPKPRSEQKPQEPQGEIVPQGSRSPTLGRSQELAFQVPDVRSLREPLTLARSLRPLLRRVATGNSTILNEAATIQRIVEEQLWIPVLQPSLEPWLDLALVVDESDSMLIWRRTVTELQRLLENYGVFRTVRVWGLVEVEDRVQIRPGFGVSARRQRNHSPNELVDPNGRCLVLVVSDCVAPLWQSGQVLPALKAWSQCGAMAIVQMLPEWLWRRTALGLATAVQLRALAPGLPNQQLTVSASESWDEADLETGIKVPVITLEPELFATWTQVVAGRGGVWTPGVVFEPSFAAMEEEEDILPTDLTAEQRVQRFRLTASPMARRLAGLLAAAPVISLPIVRIVQDRLLSQSRQVHLAEVFLGGLLKPLMAIAPDTNPDRVQYDFFERVREVLLESLPLPDSVDVLDAVSKFVASRMGLSLEAFAAVLRNPQQVQAGEIAGQMRPFARVTAQVLKRMGGEYAKFAEQLEGTVQENDRALEAELDAALATQGEQEQATALTDLIARSPEMPLTLLRSLSAIASETDRISALIALIPHIPNALLSDVLKMVRVLQNTSSRFQGLAALAVLLPEVVPEALQTALDIEDESARFKMLTAVVEKLPVALLQQALEAARTLEDDYSRALVLIALANKLPEIIPTALDTVLNVENTYWRAQAYMALADKLTPEVLSRLPENLRQQVSQIIEAPSRVPLRQLGNTQVYTCCTDNPWHLPFDALVIPVGDQGGLGSFGRAFQAHLSASLDSEWLSHAIGSAMRATRVNRIRPDQPLLVQLPFNVNTRLSSLSNSLSERSLICATSESEDGPSSENTSTAYESIVQLIVNRRFRHGVISLIGTGLNHLSVDKAAKGMMRAINQTLQSRESLALEEITIVDRDEDKIAAIIEISRRIVLSRRSEDFKTILFLAADPRNSAPLRLDHEAREIEEVLRLSQKRNQFQLVQQWAVTARDVQRSLLDFKPNIVHFSGHGVGQEGLALEDPNVQVKLVSSEALAKLFKLFADRGVECVLLSACYFEVQAEAIVQHIPYVIGIKQALGKQAAREFATGFYDALGAGRDIPFAYEHGRSRISLEGQAAELTPVLLKRSESSPSLSILEETRSRALRGDLVLEQPEGQVGLESVFYVDRPPIERDCYEHILQPGALIRIQAPRQMGKSSLLLRVLQRAGGRSVSINFQLVDADILTNLDQFLQWFCASVTYRLNLPDRVDHYWQGQLGSKDKCTYYFKDYLLPQLTEGLTLGLDEVDELFQYRQVAADFFGLLRFWYEEAKNKPLWKRLRLVLVHSQEVYVPLNINQSPFNVGLPIELLELTPAQVQDLWHRHRLTWTAEQQQALMQMVGGHPYLVRMALYELAKGRLTLAEFLDIAPTESGLYGEHLRRHWLNLQEGVELVAATQRVVTAQHAVELDSTAAFKLRSIGLVKFQGNGVVPRCDLYRHYFSNHLQ